MFLDFCNSAFRCLALWYLKLRLFEIRIFSLLFRISYNLNNLLLWDAKFLARILFNFLFGRFLNLLHLWLFRVRLFGDETLKNIVWSLGKLLSVLWLSNSDFAESGYVLCLLFILLCWDWPRRMGQADFCRSLFVLCIVCKYVVHLWDFGLVSSCNRFS